MTKRADNIAVTDARLHNILDKKINQVIDKRDIPSMIEKTVNDAKIHTGSVLKYYPYKDKAMVKLSNNQKVVCKLLHHMTGVLIDFFTPEGEADFCEELQEPCIVPRAELHVLVLDINDNTKEQLMLGYYHPDDFIYINPAANGCYKITNISPSNEYGLNIGMGKVEVKTLDGMEFTEGFFPEDETSIVYANKENVPVKDDVYTKKEVYTKEEVDKLIEDLREELLGDDTDADTSESG